MFSTLVSFAEKKFVIIVADQIASYDLAYASGLIGFQFGRQVPSMVGRDQMIPSQDATRKHLGITTQNLPVLNGLDYDKMRALRASLLGEKDLLVTTVTDAAGKCKTYEEYAETVKNEKNADNSTKYWAIGIFGDAAKINEITKGLKLYAKQPKLPNSETLPERRLVGNNSDLPTFRFVLANDLTGGLLANAAVVLGVTYGKLYSDTIFGADISNEAGVNVGLPMIDLAILNGHASKTMTMRELREKLHGEPDLSVVDVSDATSKTRSYPDYLALSENTKVLDTVYYGIGICGKSELVAKYTADLNSYISSAEEQDLIKKQAAAKKWESRKNPANVAESAEKKRVSPLTEAAVTGGLGWQTKVVPTAENEEVKTASLALNK